MHGNLQTKNSAIGLTLNDYWEDEEEDLFLEEAEMVDGPDVLLEEPNVHQQGQWHRD